MSIIDLIGLGVSSVVMVVLSKSRFHCKSNCCSYTYNEHQIDISKLNDERDEMEDEFNDRPIDSYKTLPPPEYETRVKKPLGVYDLTTMTRK